MVPAPPRRSSGCGAGCCSRAPQDGRRRHADGSCDLPDLGGVLAHRSQRRRLRRQDQLDAEVRRVEAAARGALADSTIIDGIGNAYSNEILHAARLSPFKRTRDLTPEETATLLEAATALLRRYTQRLEEQFTTKFPGPGDVTAFRPDFAVHGKFGQSCPACGTAVQRVRFAENEMNYCPRCQTGGRVLADRSLSRLLKDEWPRTVEELEG